jgi:hypothetical protein
VVGYWPVIRPEREGAQTGGVGETFCEACALAGEAVEVGGVGESVAVAAEIRAGVFADDEEEVGRFVGLGLKKMREGGGEGGGEEGAAGEGHWGNIDWE